MRKALLSAQGTQTALVVKDRIFLCIPAEDDLGIPLKGFLSASAKDAVAARLY